MDRAGNYSVSLGGACLRHRLSCLADFSGFLTGHIIVNITLCAVLAIAAVLGNGLVFAAYYYSESLRRPAHILLLSLAATDLLSGLVAQPLFIAEKCFLVGTSCNTTICWVYHFERMAMVYLQGATVLNLSMTTVDRYIAVCHSYRYPELVTNSRVKQMIAVLWSSWTLTFLVSIIVFQAYSILLVVVLSFNIVSITVLYFKIVRELRRIVANAETAGNVPEQERSAHERNSVRTLLYIFGLLFACFVPFIIYGLINIFKGKTMQFSSKESMLVYASSAAFSNSSLNVFVYYWRNEELRLAMRKVMRKLRNKFHTEVDPQS